MPDISATNTTSAPQATAKDPNCYQARANSFRQPEDRPPCAPPWPLAMSSPTPCGRAPGPARVRSTRSPARDARSAASIAMTAPPAPVTGVTARRRRIRCRHEVRPDCPPGEPRCLGWFPQHGQPPEAPTTGRRRGRLGSLRDPATPRVQVLTRPSRPVRAPHRIAERPSAQQLAAAVRDADAVLDDVRVNLNQAVCIGAAGTGDSAAATPRSRALTALPVDRAWSTHPVLSRRRST